MKNELKSHARVTVSQESFPEEVYIEVAQSVALHAEPNWHQ